MFSFYSLRNQLAHKNILVLWICLEEDNIILGRCACTKAPKKLKAPKRPLCLDHTLEVINSMWLLASLSRNAVLTSQMHRRFSAETGRSGRSCPSVLSTVRRIWAQPGHCSLQFVVTKSQAFSRWVGRGEISGAGDHFCLKPNLGLVFGLQCYWRTRSPSKLSSFLLPYSLGMNVYVQFLLTIWTLGHWKESVHWWTDWINPFNKSSLIKDFVPGRMPRTE